MHEAKELEEAKLELKLQMFDRYRRVTRNFYVFAWLLSWASALWRTLCGTYAPGFRGVYLRLTMVAFHQAMRKGMLTGGSPVRDIDEVQQTTSLRGAIYEDRVSVIQLRRHRR